MSDLTITFPSKESKEMTIRGLLDLHALFEMRLDEAKSASSEPAIMSAENELERVREALRAFSQDT